VPAKDSTCSTSLWTCRFRIVYFLDFHYSCWKGQRALLHFHTVSDKSNSAITQLPGFVPSSCEQYSFLSQPTFGFKSRHPQLSWFLRTVQNRQLQVLTKKEARLSSFRYFGKLRQVCAATKTLPSSADHNYCHFFTTTYLVFSNNFMTIWLWKILRQPRI